jgi:oligopeptide/dipeptide ABC transporter ATP-binding protein
MRPLLEIESLRVEFTRKGRSLPAVSEVSLAVDRGRTLGVVGESGSGKTVTALSILRLVPSPPGRIVAGRIWFQDRDLLAVPEEEMARIRGKDISMVFQEPMTALNPVFTVGEQVAEVYRIHLRLGKGEAWSSAVEMLAKVGISDAARRACDYPHQLSGGMRQRVLIAIALACRPALLIADEPTTALDVTVQAQILTLMDQLRAELGTAVLLITHDFGVVAEMADDVAVMYAGRIVEHASSRELFAAPWHPYTELLLRSRPVIGQRAEGRHLTAIPGSVPDPAHLPPACHFEPRCPRRKPVCAQIKPELEEKSPGHLARCWVPPP